MIGILLGMAAKRDLQIPFSPKSQIRGGERGGNRSEERYYCLSLMQATCNTSHTVILRCSLFSLVCCVTSSPHLGSEVHRFPFHPPDYPSSFSLAGSGRGVEGFSSGRPNPRLTLRAMKNTIMLYNKYSHTHPLLPHLKRRSSNNILK